MKERPIMFSGPMVCAILEGRKTMTRRVLKVQPPDSSYQLSRMIESTAKDERKHEGKLHWIKLDVDNNLRILKDDRRYFSCPYGNKGDLLWVKETWRRCPERFLIGDGILYENNLNEYFIPLGPLSPLTEEGLSKSALQWCDKHHIPRDGKWRSPLFMPRILSRITLEITDIRAERLHEITDEDAYKEGVTEKERCYGYRNLDNGYSMDWEEKPERTPRLAFGNYFNLVNKSHGHRWEDNPMVWVISFQRIGQ